VSNPEPARIRALVQQETGWDVDGLLSELESIPRKVYDIRQELAPLRSEMRMLEDRFASKGRSPSHWDIERGVLLSELKEEARILYYRDRSTKRTRKATGFGSSSRTAGPKTPRMPVRATGNSLKNQGLIGRESANWGVRPGIFTTAWKG
jgi:hypothetical protein